MEHTFIKRAVLIIFHIIGIYCSASQRVIERIRYLENRVNSESKFRAEDYEDIIDRLNEIDKRLNASLEQKVGLVNVAPETGEVDLKSVQHLREDFTRLWTAFKDEKSETARIRREIPKIENNLISVKQEMDKYCMVNLNKTEQLISRVEEADEFIKTDIALQINDITEEQKSLRNEINDTSVLEKEEFRVQTAQIKETLQDTIEKAFNRITEEQKTLRNEITEEQKSLRNEITEEQKTLRNEITEEQKSLRNEITEEQKALRNEITEEQKSLRNEITEEQIALRNEINHTSFLVREEFRIVAAEIEKHIRSIFEKSITLNNNTGEEIVEQVKINTRKTENIEMLVTGLYYEIVSCSSAKKSGILSTRTYTLQNGLWVFCDQTTDGGGWTVFQRRINGEVDFYRNWTEYKNGFGDVNGEFWLGNEHLSILTSTGDHELRIDMEDFWGNRAFAKYSKFKIYPEEYKYKLEASGYIGNAGDSLNHHNGMAFSTFDNDNENDSRNCAKEYHGAWWYKSCHHSNLNGKYIHTPSSCKSDSTEISWYHWENKFNCLKSVEMKFR